MYSIKKIINCLACVTLTTFASSIIYADDKGVWSDPKNKLIWMRCSIGQTWTGSSCSGEAIGLTWNDAVEYPSLFNQDGFAGKRDWRLPTISELSTLRRCRNGWAHEIKTIGNLTKDMGIDMVSIPNGGGTKQVPQYCDYDGSFRPALDTNIFPNTRGDRYWSSSPVAHDSDQAWYVYFGNGDPDNIDKSASYYVRLVRSSQ